MTQRGNLTVTVNGAAELLGISPWTVREWVGKGYLPCVRIGRRVLFSVKALEQAVADHEVPAYRRRHGAVAGQSAKALSQ